MSWSSSVLCSCVGGGRCLLREANNYFFKWIQWDSSSSHSPGENSFGVTLFLHLEMCRGFPQLLSVVTLCFHLRQKSRADAVCEEGKCWQEIKTRNQSCWNKGLRLFGLRQNRNIKSNFSQEYQSNFSLAPRDNLNSWAFLAFIRPLPAWTEAFFCFFFKYLAAFL